MLCSSCANECNSDVCSHCSASPLLDGRYRLENIVGQGAVGTTFRATRISDGAQVCVKQLHVHLLKSFEALDLFEREARVLRQLHHPAIPVYIDDFRVGAGKALALCLVQEFVDGKTLAEELQTRRYTEREILEIMAELLPIFEYLHGLSPPVIHRDVKPGNLMRRSSDGRLMLVDFGSVRDALVDPQLGGQTVTGTFGYMAPEQLYGRASPASDLYALGVTAVVLLTRQEPAALANDRNELAWRNGVRPNSPLGSVLQKLIVTSAQDRAQSATEVLSQLRAPLDKPKRRAPAEKEPIPRPRATHKPEDPPLEVDLLHSMPSRRGIVIVSFALTSVAIIAVVAAGVGEQPSVVAVPVAAAEQLCGTTSPCKAVDQDIKGLRFGMTVAEAKKAIPELASAYFFSDTGGLGKEMEPPGGQWTFATKLNLAGESATCDFHFSGKKLFSKMKCKFHDKPDAERLVNNFKEKFGLPSTQSNEEGIFSRHTRTWRDSIAELTLVSDSITSLPGSGITLDYHTIEHERLRSEYKHRLVLEHAEKEQRDEAERAERRRSAGTGL